MSSFEEAVIQRINQLEREVERLKRWERPIVITDHGALAGLGDDDHTQYLNTTRHDTTTRHTLGTVVPHDSHSSLSNLSNDDHAQYTKHPASSTDNAIARWDGTGGRTLQNSSVAIDDNGKLSGDGLDGWVYDTDVWYIQQITPVYQFKIVSKDVRYRFPKGTKIKLVQSGATKYFYVIAAAYTSGNTIVTITGGSDYALANENISGQAYSYADTPQGYPFSTVAIRVERSTNQSIPNTAWTALSFDTIITEEKPATTSQWSSGSPTRLICRLPGYYLVNAHVRFAANATGVRGINLMKNGTALGANIFIAFSGQDSTFQFSAITKLDTGDYVETLCYQDSGGGLAAVATSNNLYLEWIRLGI